MSDLYDQFLSRWNGVDPLGGPASPAGDLALAERFEKEMNDGGPAQFLWNCFPHWEKILDGAERAYRAMGAERQLAALSAIRAKLREFAPLCGKRIDLAKKAGDPGMGFEIWFEGAEGRMSLPEEALFHDNEPALAAKRLAYLEANRATLFA